MTEIQSTQASIASNGISLEEKKRFLASEALPAMAEFTFPYVCSIIGLLDQQTGCHLGSGLRCALNGRPAILTALHVIQRAIAEPRGFAISAGYGRPPFPVRGDVNVDPIGDVAACFLPQDYPDEGLAFWPSDRVDRERSRLTTDYLFVHGFPGSQSYSSQHLKAMVSKSLPCGAMQRLDNLPPDLTPSEFAIEYAPPGMATEAGTSAEAVDPHGLSGSPVWRIGISGRTRREWKAQDSLLVGVVTHWRPQQNILIATSAERLPETEGR